MDTCRQKIPLRETECIFMELSKCCGKLLLNEVFCNVNQVLEWRTIKRRCCVSPQRRPVEQDRMALLFWIGKNTTSHSQALNGVLVLSMKVLQQFSNPDDNLHRKMFGLLLGEYWRLESNHLKIISALPTDDGSVENKQKDRRYPSQDPYLGF